MRGHLNNTSPEKMNPRRNSVPEQLRMDLLSPEIKGPPHIITSSDTPLATPGPLIDEPVESLAFTPIAKRVAQPQRDVNLASGVQQQRPSSPAVYRPNPEIEAHYKVSLCPNLIEYPKSNKDR